MGISVGRSRKKFLDEMRINKMSAKPGPHDFRIVLDGLKPTFNIAKIFRSAQAFGAQGIDLIKIASFNPYPSLGATRYVPARFHDEFAAAHRALRADGFTIFAFDVNATELLTDVKLPKRAAFVMGHEEFGLSFRTDDYPDVRALRIPMYGQVQSLNVSVAASVAMFEYVRQHGSPADEVRFEGVSRYQDDDEHQPDEGSRG
jgi:tRNA G18 (ribose-2'-O)-methylase SpoU